MSAGVGGPNWRDYADSKLETVTARLQGHDRELQALQAQLDRRMGALQTALDVLRTVQDHLNEATQATASRESLHSLRADVIFMKERLVVLVDRDRLELVVGRIETRLEAIEARVDVQERVAESMRSVETYRRWMVGLGLGTAVGVAGLVLDLTLRLLHH